MSLYVRQVLILYTFCQLNLIENHRIISFLLQKTKKSIYKNVIFVVQNNRSSL